MSSVTRVGFTIPAITDFADEIIYHDNNITVYENELPSLVQASLPVSGNYAGRTAVLNNPQTSNPPFPSMPFDEYLYNGSAWIPVSSAGLRRLLTNYVIGDSSPIASAGPEIWSAVIPGFSQIDVQAGSIIKFSVMGHLAFSYNGGTGGTPRFNGKFNIFLNPNSSAQPGPLTPGAPRLSFPIVESDDSYLNSGHANPVDPFYGELLYAASVAGTIGVGAYLSVTNDSPSVYVHDPASDGYPPSIPSNGCRILTEVSGTWSG